MLAREQGNLRVRPRGADGLNQRERHNDVAKPIRKANPNALLSRERIVAVQPYGFFKNTFPVFKI